jgi:hypothetical protein
MAAEFGRGSGLRRARKLVFANPNAIEFYKACGFRMLGEVLTPFRPGYRLNKTIGPPK